MGSEAGIAPTRLGRGGRCLALFVHERDLHRVAARAYGRLGLRLPAQSPPSGSSSGARDEPRTAPSSWIALAVAHPNRATEIIPLISGNCTR